MNSVTGLRKIGIQFAERVRSRICLTIVDAMDVRPVSQHRASCSKALCLGHRILSSYHLLIGNNFIFEFVFCE